jgi:hypothetical protein
MIFSTADHCGGLTTLPKAQRREVETALKAITVLPAKGAAVKMRREFLASLKTSGWTNELTVDPESGMTITASRSGVGLCLQTGNIARMYADLMKLQTLYLNGAIEVAVMVVPSGEVARLLGSNIAATERLQRELKVFRKTHHVPTAIYSLEVSA